MSTKLFSTWAKTCAPELVAEVFLNVELRLCCDRLKIIDHACDSASGSAQYSITDRFWDKDLNNKSNQNLKIRTTFDRRL